MSFVPSLKRNLAYLRLGVIAKLQYPWLFCASLLMGPSLLFGIEALFWTGCFETSGKTEIGGFTLPQYLAYFLWMLLNLGSSTSWRFERAMIREINTGAVNAMLVRPGSFYGLHLGDILGFKLAGFIVLVPLMLLLQSLLDLPLMLERLPLALLMGIGYIFFVHTLNFAVASLAFFFDHIYSLNTTKNMLLWFLTGEIFPLDLLPAAISRFVILLPFSAGIYLPASYLSGRIGHLAFFHGFLSLAIGIIVISFLAHFIWKKGVRNYTGTGS